MGTCIPTRAVGLAVGLAVAVSVSACGAHRANLRPAHPPAAVDPRPAPAPAPAAKIEPVAGQRMTRGELETFMAKVRELSTRTRPEKTDLPTVETSDPRLRAALEASIATPTPATLRALAAEYQRVGIVDRAQGALERAVRLKPNDPSTYDRLARLWRDEGLPHLALGDAHRAVHYSHGTAETRNTLGTVLQAMGRPREAAIEFAAVVAKQPGAAYGWSNLCYASIADGRPMDAADACQRALRLAPQFAAAQNNLGLARAQAGDFKGAAAAFSMGGNRPRADFNLGMVQAATGQYNHAASAFERAHQAVPEWKDAALLAWQAGRASRAVAEGSVIE